MFRYILIAAALVGSAPAMAFEGPAGAPPETSIRNMTDYLEAVVDPQRGVYIRGYTGQWYYARVQGLCPRLNRNASLRFNPSPGGDFDRDSTIRADGWRCMIASVVESDAPPRPSRRH